MTESEWLTSTNPAAMWRHLNSIELMGKDDSFSCDDLRCIFGNPFRRTRPQRFLEQHTGQDCCDRHADQKACDCRSDWNAVLQWSNGLLPRMAQQMRGGERCEVCDGEGMFEAADIRVCSICHGTGKTPPRFADIPVLLDAYLEACEELRLEPEEEIVMHLRGMARCPHCLGTGKEESRYGSGPDCVPTGCIWCGGDGDFKKGTGWLRSDAGHCSGCWVLSLFCG